MGYPPSRTNLFITGAISKDKQHFLDALVTRKCVKNEYKNSSVMMFAMLHSTLFFALQVYAYVATEAIYNTQCIYKIILY